MLGHTHVTVGMATALAVLQPATPAAVACVALGGGLGGWISDVDVRGLGDRRDVVEGALILAGLGVLAWVADGMYGLGIAAYLQAWTGSSSMWGALGFVALVLIGTRCDHRGFTHSIAGAALWSWMAYLACPPVANAFALGIASHLALDLLNKKGLKLLLPLSRHGFSLDLCTADGVVNSVLGIVGTVCAVGLLAWLFATSAGVTELLPVTHTLQIAIS